MISLKRAGSASATALILSELVLVHAQQSCDECTECESSEIKWCLDKGNESVVAIQDISNTEWPYSTRFTIFPQNSCWFMTTKSSYISWEGNEAITVKAEAYRDAADGNGCEVKAAHCLEDQDYYPKNQQMYTTDTPWPFNKDDVCAYRYIFFNDQVQTNNNVDVFTWPEVPERSAKLIMILASVTASSIALTMF